MIMTLIEEWRWDKPEGNPLQPFWNSIISFLMIEYEKAATEKREREKEELIKEVIKRLELIDDD